MFFIAWVNYVKMNLHDRYQDALISKFELYCNYIKKKNIFSFSS